MSSESVIPFERLSHACQRAGFSIVGITDVTPASEAEKRLDRWQQSGMAGELAYMKRSPELLSDPRRLLPEARTLIVLSVNYARTPAPPFRTGFGRVARYAWGRDYHRVLRRRLTQLVASLEESTGPFPHRFFTDSVPLLERAFAERAGLGFIGKNTMLIRPGHGSYSLLAELLLGIDVEHERSLNVISDSSCGSCSRCITHCPTSAFTEEYVLDARRCISYLTIEKRGALEVWEREALGEWVFGCDVCQQVCPFNHGVLKRETESELLEFKAEAGAGPLLDLKALLTIRSDAQFVKHFQGTPLMRAKRAGLLRNGAVVAANTGAAELQETLAASVREDPSEIVRSHALWALSKLKNRCDNLSRPFFDLLLDKAWKDSSEVVRHEAERIQELQN